MKLLSLKTQNIAPLSLLILLQVALAHAVSLGSYPVSDLEFLTRKGGLLLVISLLACWFSYLLSTEVKSKIVFLRLKQALPGHRFIQLAAKDPRIDFLKMQQKVQNFVELQHDNEKQNRYWYATVYRPIKDEIEVNNAQKAYLLYRDAAAVSLITFLFAVFAAQFIPVVRPMLSLQACLVFLVFASGFARAANIAGKAFVTCAVAVWLTKSEDH